MGLTVWQSSFQYLEYTMLEWFTDPHKALTAVGLAWIIPLITVLEPQIKEWLWWALISVAISFGVPRTWLRILGCKDDNKIETPSEDESDKNLTPFLQDQKAKSRRKVCQIDNDKNSSAVITKCTNLMGTVVRVGGFSTTSKVKKSQGIRDRKSFDRIVDNVGIQLNLNKDHIAGIKEAANADKDQFKIFDFKGGMTQNGEMILHTGSYLVERFDNEDGSGDRFNFGIAMSVISITEIEFRRLGEAAAAATAAIQGSWFKSSSPSLEIGDSLSPRDWETYFDYTANKNLLSYI